MSVNLSSAERADLANELRADGWPAVAEDIESGSLSPEAVITTLRAIDEPEIADKIASYLS